MDNRLRNFIISYFDKIENIIYFAENTEESLKEINVLLDKERKNIPWHLMDSGLDENINSIKRSDIKKALVQNVDKAILPNDLDHFISTMFYQDSVFSHDEINNYQEKIEKYRLTEDINSLYDLTFLSDNSNKTLEELSFKTVLTNAFESLAVKDKAEVLSNLNIFFEEFIQTDLGKKRLELIHQKYLDDKDKTNPIDASKNWLENIIECANNASPKSIAIEYDKISNKTITKTEGGGKFDGFYIINKTILNSEQKKELDNIKKLNELDDFEDSMAEKMQIQVSATSDRGLDIEQDSIIRHSLANMVISTILNKHWNNTRDINFLEAFSQKVTGTEGNANIRGAINEAFSQVIGDSDFSEIEKTDPAKKFDKIQYLITSHSTKYIKKLLNKEKDDLYSLNESDMRDFLSLSKEGEQYFNPKCYISLYYQNRVKNDIKENVNDNVFNGLTNTEKSLLMQHSALLKMNFTKHIEDIDLNGINLLVNEAFRLRGISPKEKLNNQYLSSLDIQDIDRAVLETFLFNNDNYENSQNLDLKSKDCFSKIISSLLENKTYLEQINEDEQLFLDKVKDMLTFKSPSCFGHKYYKGIRKDHKYIELDKKMFKVEQEAIENEQKLKESKKEVMESKQRVVERDEEILNLTAIQFISNSGANLLTNRATEQDYKILSLAKKYFNIEESGDLFILKEEDKIKLYKQFQKENTNKIGSIEKDEIEDLKDEISKLNEETPNYIDKNRKRKRNKRK